MKDKNEVNLGQLLEAVDVLDRAASGAPLNRNDHATVMQRLQLLREALPQLWMASRKGNGKNTDEAVTVPTPPPPPVALPDPKPAATDG